MTHHPLPPLDMGAALRSNDSSRANSGASNMADPEAVLEHAKELDALAATDAQEEIPDDKLRSALDDAPFCLPSVVLNMRDAGQVLDSEIPKGRVYRCGRFDDRADRAGGWLTAHNVTAIFDLRSKEEREEPRGKPDPEFKNVKNVWLAPEGTYEPPQLSDYETAAQAAAAWGETYLGMARDCRPGFRAVLEHIRDNPGDAFIVHCLIGRDRTSILVGLLHHLAGSPVKAAERDYMLSRIGLEPERDFIMDMARKTAGGCGPEAKGFCNLIQLRPAYWNAFIEALNKEFPGGWDEYVTSAYELGGLGFSESDLQTLKHNILVEQTAAVAV